MVSDAQASGRARNTIFVLTCLVLTLAGVGLLTLGAKRVDWGSEFGAALFTTGVLGTVWQFTVDYWQRRGIVDAMHQVLGEPGRGAGLTDILLEQDNSAVQRALRTAKHLDAICLFDGRWLDPWRKELTKFLERGGRARFIIPDHEDAALMVMLSRRHGWSDPIEFVSRVRSLQTALADMASTWPALEFRMLDAPGPAHTAYLLQGRTSHQEGLGVIRPYEHRMLESAGLTEIFFAQSSGLYIRFQTAFESAWKDALPPPRPRSKEDGIFVLVSGPGNASTTELELAEKVGKELTRGARGARTTVLTGGLGGVMDAALRGSQSARKASINRLAFPPGLDLASVSPAATHVVLSGWGEGRDALLVDCADVVIAVGYSPGSLAEVALARKKGIEVVSLAFPEDWAEPDGRLFTVTHENPREAARAAALAGQEFAEQQIARGAFVPAAIRRALATST